MMPPSLKKTVGFEHFWGAMKNSVRGFFYAWDEAAFRQECFGFIIIIPLAFYFATSVSQALLLSSLWLIVLLVELINTAIEKTLDKISVDYDPLIGRAKDLGAAAVLLSIMIVFILWVAILW